MFVNSYSLFSFSHHLPLPNNNNINNINNINNNNTNNNNKKNIKKKITHINSVLNNQTKSIVSVHELFCCDRHCEGPRSEAIVIYKKFMESLQFAATGVHTVVVSIIHYLFIYCYYSFVVINTVKDQDHRLLLYIKKLWPLYNLLPLGCILLWLVLFIIYLYIIIIILL